MADVKVTTPAPPRDVKEWKETQGFMEEVISMAKRVVAECEKHPENVMATQKLAKAKALMAQGDWAGAMKMFQEMVGGKGTVANKATNLNDWANDVLIVKSSRDTIGGQDTTLSAWAGEALAKADGYSSAVIEAAVRNQLYHEMYHKESGLSDDLLAQHVADEVIANCSYSNKDELKSVVAKGGRQAIVDMAMSAMDSVKKIAATRKAHGPCGEMSAAPVGY